MPPLPAGVVVEGKDYYTTCVECIFGVTDIDSAIEDLNTRYNAAYDKLVECGGNLATAKEKGLIRSEGKEYVVKDGDVMHFLFNV